MKNFGLLPDGGVSEPGINAKLNEVQAAIGLLLLDKVRAEIQKRKDRTADYAGLLAGVHGIRIVQPADGVLYNYPYFVISIDKAVFGISRDALYDELTAHNIFARKYFYPLCSNFACYRDLPSSDPSRLPIANKAADSVLALPLYGDLSHEETAYICAVIRESGSPAA